MSPPIRKIAGAPISWGVCEVPGWGHQLTPHRVLSEMASLGLTATELGPDGFLPADPVALRALLAQHGLRLVAGFVPAVLHDPDHWTAERNEVQRQIETLAAGGAEMVVLAAATGDDGYEAPAKLAPAKLDDGEWAHLAGAVAEIERMAGDLGLRVSLHPHYGTMVERPAEIHRLTEESPVALCLDTGHVMVGDGDPLEMARRYATRITHVHLKDVDAALAARVPQMSYHAAVAAGLYRPLGQGAVDIVGIIAALDTVGFDGWYVLEQDQVVATEPAQGAGPIEDAAVSHRFLQGIPAG